MKTVNGKCVSSKPVSLSKAAKILSKFVSVENGASHVISAYLHRASVAFNELKQLHTELESSNSNKNYKRKRMEESHGDSGRTVENSVISTATNQELSRDGSAQSKNKSKRRRLGKNDDVGDEKSTQTVVKGSQEVDGSIGDHAGSEKHNKHKKHKRKKQEI